LTIFCFGSAELRAKSLLTTPRQCFAFLHLKPKSKFAVW
jgi:hypothetical protein